MADTKTKDPFAGYTYADYPEAYNSPKPASGARGAKKAFESNVEGMKSLYEKNKKPTDPDSATMAKRLGQGDVEALRIMQKAVNARSQEMKKGGVVKSSASKRGDGCAQRGKTKGRMV